MLRTARFGFPAVTALAALAGLILVEDAARAATTWTVHVGRNGNNFVDDASGTSTTTIHVGDTVTWVWEGAMQHSVTSGTCPDDHGGGGGGYVTAPHGSVTGGMSAPGYGTGGDCTGTALWQATGLQSSGFSFSQTFTTQGTVSYFCAMHQSAMTGKVVVQPASVNTGPCVAGVHTLCLNGGRFEVTAHWTKPDTSQGDGNAVGLTGDSGYFWFFDATNIEAIVKVLNGCGLTNSYWVFAAGLTNIAVHVQVRDSVTGAVYTRDNAQGSAFSPVQDTAAFPTSCP